LLSYYFVFDEYDNNIKHNLTGIMSRYLMDGLSQPSKIYVKISMDYGKERKNHL